MRRPLGLMLSVVFTVLFVIVPASAAESSGNENGIVAQYQLPQHPTIGPATPGPRCEWLPREEELAAIQCGYSDAGIPSPGIFDCGVRSEGGRCVRYCAFKRCNEP
jgi:hypothetical protein